MCGGVEPALCAGSWGLGGGNGDRAVPCREAAGAWGANRFSSRSGPAQPGPAAAPCGGEGADTDVLRGLRGADRLRRGLAGGGGVLQRRMLAGEEPTRV